MKGESNMLSDKQKKIATGVGLGSAAALGTVLAVRHHHKKSSHSHEGEIYYGNGVYCDNKSGKCHVDWERARHDIAHMMVHGYIDSLGSILGELGGEHYAKAMKHLEDTIKNLHHK